MPDTYEAIPLPEAVAAPADPADDRALGPEAALPAGQATVEKAAEKTGPQPPSRLSLRISANWWRSLQRVGMSLHYLAPPRPPNPDFVRTIPCTLGRPGQMTLQFYVPKDYHQHQQHQHDRQHHQSSEPGHHTQASHLVQMLQNLRRRARPPPPTYPAVINFHGGGFTLGAGTDDARFARTVVETSHAIFISVDYRLSPEFPFPVAVDDAADAVLWVARNAEELRVDPHRLATSGFSAGGNLALTCGLRIARLREQMKQTAEAAAGVGGEGSKAQATAQVIEEPSASKADARNKQEDQKKPAAARQEQQPLPDYRLLAVATWYPIADYTLTRAERRRTCLRPDQAIPPVLTDLFDASYLYPPGLDLSDPCLSPSQASDELLRDGIPERVLFYTAEWDMLLREGEAFSQRLASPKVGKKVDYYMIPGVPHGWDKGPSPWRPPPKSEELYKECCGRLKEVFEAAKAE